MGKKQLKKTVPMGLIPAVCGAVKCLQECQLAKTDTDTNSFMNQDIYNLKREGLVMAKEAMERALSKRVLEITSTGNFRLKVVKNSKVAGELAQLVYASQPKPKRVMRASRGRRTVRTRRVHGSKAKRIQPLRKKTTTPMKRTISKSQKLLKMVMKNVKKKMKDDQKNGEEDKDKSGKVIGTLPEKNSKADSQNPASAQPPNKAKPSLKKKGRAKRIKKDENNTTTTTTNNNNKPESEKSVPLKNRLRNANTTQQVNTSQQTGSFNTLNVEKAARTPPLKTRQKRRMRNTPVPGPMETIANA